MLTMTQNTCCWRFTAFPTTYTSNF